MSPLQLIQERYRSGAHLSNADKACLEDIILLSDDLFAIQSALYIYGISFPENKKITRRAESFIRSTPVPGLTATSLKVLADFWQMHEIYRDDLEGYLDYCLYDDWSDEVTASASFFLRHPDLQDEVIALKLHELERCARAERDTGLLDFFVSSKAS